MRIGIVLCSRLDSERIPGKVMRKINGQSVLKHLLIQLARTGIETFLAIPEEQFEAYDKELNTPPFANAPTKVTICASQFAGDPLARMNAVAQGYALDTIIRVTHDKIFVDVEQIPAALEVFFKAKADYLYFPDMIPGTGFEIFSAECIAEASSQFKNVEHISYAARLVSRNTVRLNSARVLPDLNVPLNLLIDFPEDLQLHELIFSKLKNEINLSEVLNIFKAWPIFAAVNRAPLVTIYTCAYNAAETLDKALNSVAHQGVFENAEYILIDDHSSDETCTRMALFSLFTPNVKWYRNEKNIGLAASSNRALKLARGRYVIRLDADDFFTGTNSVNDMVDFMAKTGVEALYPDNHFGEFNKIQKGKENHHVGGALFDKRAINFVKFTDGLRNYEGLDLFARAQDKLKIGYFEKPTFFYRQSDSSMSKTNLVERAEVKRQIEEAICAKKA